MTHADGFETTGTDVRRWVGRWPDSTVRLLKLHGSIDWWRYNFVDQGWSGSVAARFVGDDPQHPKCPQVIGGCCRKLSLRMGWKFGVSVS